MFQQADSARCHTPSEARSAKVKSSTGGLNFALLDPEPCLPVSRTILPPTKTLAGPALGPEFGIPVLWSPLSKRPLQPQIHTSGPA